MFAAIQNPAVNSTENICMRSGNCFEKIPRKWGMTVTCGEQAANIPFKGWCKL